MRGECNWKVKTVRSTPKSVDLHLCHKETFTAFIADSPKRQNIKEDIFLVDSYGSGRLVQASFCTFRDPVQLEDVALFEVKESPRFNWKLCFFLRSKSPRDIALKRLFKKCVKENKLNFVISLLYPFETTDNHKYAYLQFNTIKWDYRVKFLMRDAYHEALVHFESFNNSKEKR